ncbi:MAG: Sua5/YciO/YrdC/YwlC family protein [Planctomycetales bacterium]|nr:Sua5/YciO/YrdC/YwlC family protein [Planctomycetales bacterium]
MPSIIDWKSSEDTRDVVHSIVQTLAEGRLVVMPADAGYQLVCSGLESSAVEQLAQRSQNDCSVLYLRSCQEALDYAPGLSLVAERCVRRGWPGPLEIELPADAKSGLLSGLPDPVQQFVSTVDGFVAMSVSPHDAFGKALRLLPGPLVGIPLLDDRGQAVQSGKRAAEAADRTAAIVISDRELAEPVPASRIRIDKNKCKLIQLANPGLEQLGRLTEWVVLLVCTGNTCRSPMAEALLRRTLNKRFPKIADRTPSAFTVASAGLNAFPGGMASSEAKQTMRKRGLNIDDHQSSMLTDHALRYADTVLTMTNAHRNAIVNHFPELAAKVQLLSHSNRDVADPFGGSQADYEACADEIDNYLSSWVDLCEEEWFPEWQID